MNIAIHSRRQRRYAGSRKMWQTYPLKCIGGVGWRGQRRQDVLRERVTR